MRKKLKGGLEGIIALVILAGIVIALIIAVVLPMAKGTVSTGNAAVGRVDTLEKTISGEKTN